MARFKFTAIDRSGKQKSGNVEAASEKEAKSKISAMGLMVTNVSVGAGGKAKKAKVKSSSKGVGFSFGSPINQESLTIFTRQMATLLNSGLPLLRALEVMIRQEKNVKFKAMLDSLAESVRSGNTLSDSLLQFPKTFDKLFINMVKAGEAGGVLEVVLDRLATFMEKSVKTKKKVKSAMVYPMVVVTVAILIVAGLMVFVVPQFQGIFNDMMRGAPLPAPTQVVINVSEFVKGNIVATVLLVGGVIFLFSSIRRIEAGRKFADNMALVTPKVGDLVSKATISRFTRTFGTLLSSGVPILQALQITREIVGNAKYEDAIDRIHNSVRDGEALSAPMERESVFPTMVTSMIDVGEETGELPEMLNRVADNYDEDLDNAVASVTSIIEPVMIVFLAVVVGFIVIALFLPIVEIIQKLT
ncbi:MAG: type II secretion system F family protein [Verrucomicrobiota bacterium]